MFLADHETIVNPEHPIVAVDTSPAEWCEDTGLVRGQTIRIIPEQIWSIENNLSISNMGFDDFVRGTQPDGVYRGFPRPAPAHILTTAELLDAVDQNTSTEALARLHDTVQEFDADRTWPLSRGTNFTPQHKHVSESDHSGAETLIGRDEYLDATATAGPMLYLMLSIPRGYWQVVFEDNTLRPIAAMMVQMRCQLLHSNSCIA